MADRPTVVAALLVGCLVLAGCLGGPAQRGSGAPEPTTSSGAVLVVTRANQTAAANQPAATAVRFETLSADRQDEFLAALEGEVRDPTQWDPGTDIAYVRYEGTWYWVTVVIEN